MEKGIILTWGVIFTFFLLVPIVFIAYFLYWPPESVRKNGGEFAKSCNDLNGKPFTFENISKVIGLADLNGRHKITREQIEKFKNKNNSEYPLSIYKDSWFKSFGREYSWICKIEFNRKNSSINSFAKFYELD